MIFAKELYHSSHVLSFIAKLKLLKMNVFKKKKNSGTLAWPEGHGARGVNRGGDSQFAVKKFYAEIFNPYSAEMLLYKPWKTKGFSI